MAVSAEQIDALLPQTQCGQCSYQGCRPYAQAIAEQGAAINRCPPGGEATLNQLAQLLHIDPSPLFVDLKKQPKQSAVIREAECIGCTKCIQACPVDAIIGSAKQMHSILAQECTGCGLCLEPCPMDCIELHTIAQLAYQPAKARARYQARQLRSAQTPQPATNNALMKAKQAAILAAVARAKAKKAGLG